MLGLRAAATRIKPDTWGNSFTLLHDSSFRDMSHETPSVMVNIFFSEHSVITESQVGRLITKTTACIILPDNYRK